LCAILVRTNRPEEALTTIRSFPGEIDGTYDDPIIANTLSSPAATYLTEGCYHYYYALFFVVHRCLILSVFSSTIIDINHTGVLKAMRRQCLVAVLTSHQQYANEAIESGDMTTGGKKKAIDDALIANTLGKQAAKYLKALQARNGRETKRVAHAWDGWTAPTGNNTYP
jgi:hypothetical protein